MRYLHLFSLVFVHDFIPTREYLQHINFGMRFEAQLEYFKLYVVLGSYDDLPGQNLRFKKVNRVIVEVYFGGPLQVGVAELGFQEYAPYRETI